MTATVPIADCRLDTTQWGAGDAQVVFVHDGLGSVRQWRGVPAQVATRSGKAVLAFDRAGHGGSVPVPSGAWPTDWMSREADVLAALIERCAGSQVRLVGHSDGASISLLCAARRPDLVLDVVALAPHSWVEAKCVAAIAALRQNPDGLIAALGRYHAHPEAVFEAWSGAWTSPEFAQWDIRSQLGAIQATAAIVQGDGDEFATEAMAKSTATSIGSHARLVMVPGCGHIVHRDAPDLVVALAADGSQ